VEKAQQQTLAIEWALNARPFSVWVFASAKIRVCQFTCRYLTLFVRRKIWNFTLHSYRFLFQVLLKYISSQFISIGLHLWFRSDPKKRKLPSCNLR